MWTPQPQGVAEVQAMLKQAADVKASTETLSRVRAQLENLAESNSEFIRYLVHILYANPTSGSGASAGEVAARGLSGVLLKNTLQKNWQSLDGSTLSYIYDSVIPCLRDPNKLIRSTAGHILAKLVAKTPILQKGSDILQRLMQCVRQEDDDFLSDGASLAILFIAEDAGPILDSDEAGRPLNYLVPFWIEQATHIKPLLRERALDCIECFFNSTPRAISVNVDAFLVALSRLQNDASTRVRKKVLRALYSLLQYMPERISPDLFVSIAQFSLGAMDDDEDDVAREACEFFDVSLVDGSKFTQLLVPLLPNLVPKLLAKMTYREEELFELEDELKNDSHIADQAQEWRPTFQTGTSSWSARPADLQRDDVTESNENGDGLDEGPYWTTRRIASLVLDRLSKNINRSQLAEHFLPALFTRLQSQDWKERESGILALGAVATGGLLEDLKPSLPNLIPYLITQANDEAQPLVRRISLWTLSRFARLIVDSPFLQAVLELVLNRFKDGNKSVQASSLGTLAEIFEACEGKQVLIPYLRTILGHMSAGFDFFQVNNVCHLLDAFTALFKHYPTRDYIRDPNLIPIYMPKIWTRFASLAPGDVNLPSMTWFLAQACATLGPNFFPFAEPALNRCKDIMEETLSLAQAALDVGEPLGFGDFEHLQCTLELLSSLVSALKSEFVRSPISQICAQLVFKCASFLPDPDVIEVAVGVLGDMCMFCPSLLAGSEMELVRLFTGIAQDFDMARMNSGPCRNATWALGELIAASPRLFQENPNLVELGMRIAGSLMIFREDKIEWASETPDVAAILAGNLVLASPDVAEQSFLAIGEHNGHPRKAMQSWTKILFRMSEEIPGRIRSIEAWSILLTRRPDLADTFVTLVLLDLASFDLRQVNVEAHQLLSQLGLKLKQVYGADPNEWAKKFKPLKDEMRSRLAQVYGLSS